ncbi:MAG: adenylate kinase family enzyme [Pirellulaceae bacterium]|jgi:adenylate kinase family enzyme
MDRGSLVSDGLVVGLVGYRLDHLDCRAGCLFDGVLRTIGRANGLDPMLVKRGVLDGVHGMGSEAEVFQKIIVTVGDGCRKNAAETTHDR